jgi:hypothetical protein
MTPTAESRAYDDISGFSGTVIQIRASHYDPSLGGVNCSYFVNGECVSHMANGERWQEFIDYAIACPPSWSFGTKLIVNGKTWECKDRGGMIQIEEGIPWVDFLSHGVPFIGYRYGAIFDAILINP